ncbi:MAG: pyridoxamine 5'-phosphate oxidase family protein [Chlorobiaceae bacterium]|nr:pyridoxamine 5'-phosphate oxidase family protein [Chlorobiaceae bacterium]
MSKLPEELIQLINDRESVKVVATVGADGKPHVVVKGSLTTFDSDTIVFAEGFQGSLSNSNLLDSQVNSRPVAVNVTKGLASFQVKGYVSPASPSDKVYQTLLERIRSRRGPDAEIAGAWIVAPEEIRNESPGAAK